MHVVVNLNTLFEYEEIFFFNLFFFKIQSIAVIKLTLLSTYYLQLHVLNTNMYQIRIRQGLLLL